MQNDNFQKPNDKLDIIPPIQHQLSDPYLEKLLSLPKAMFIETPGLHGITQLQAVKMEPIFDETGGNKVFKEWRQQGDFQFKLMLSPKRKVLRLEMYDPQMFTILVEQILEHGYRVTTSGEDVEFNPMGARKHGAGGWLGWVHFMRTREDEG